MSAAIRGAAFAIDSAAEQVLQALRRRGFEQVQVTVSDTLRCELNLAHNEPSLLRSNEARKLLATGIVAGRRASSEGSDLSPWVNYEVGLADALGKELVFVTKDLLKLSN